LPEITAEQASSSVVSGVGVPEVVENTPICKPQGEEVSDIDGVLLGVLDGVLDGVLEGVFEGVFDADKVIQSAKAAVTAPAEFTPKKYVDGPDPKLPDQPK
jgi:hypothetical protein